MEDAQPVDGEARAEEVEQGETEGAHDVQEDEGGARSAGGKQEG